MKLRVGTFNVENLLTRHRFEPGGRTETAAAMSLFHFPRADERDAVERSLAVALEDDKRQMTALAIAEAQADLWNRPFGLWKDLTLAVEIRKIVDRPRRIDCHSIADLDRHPVGAHGEGTIVAGGAGAGHDLILALFALQFLRHDVRVDRHLRPCLREHLGGLLRSGELGKDALHLGHLAQPVAEGDDIVDDQVRAGAYLTTLSFKVVSPDMTTLWPS